MTGHPLSYLCATAIAGIALAGLPAAAQAGAGSTEQGAAPAPAASAPAPAAATHAAKTSAGAASATASARTPAASKPAAQARGAAAPAHTAAPAATSAKSSSAQTAKAAAPARATPAPGATPPKPSAQTAKATAPARATPAPGATPPKPSVAQATPAVASAAPASADPLPGTASVPTASVPPPAVSSTVRGGEIDSSNQPHPGTSVQWGRALAIVDAPAPEVLTVIQDYASYKSFLPNFEASRVLSKRGNAALVYVQVSILHGAGKIWAEMKLSPRKTTGPTQIVEGKMMKGNVHIFEAVWEVTPYDAKHSLVAFQILVDPDMPIPSSIISGENQKSARKAVKALRELLMQRRRV